MIQRDATVTRDVMHELAVDPHLPAVAQRLEK